MTVFALLAAFLVVCLVLAAIGWTFSVLGALIGLVFKLAPLLAIALIVLFFAKGGSVDVHLPDDWRRKK